MNEQRTSQTNHHAKTDDTVVRRSPSGRQDQGANTLTDRQLDDIVGGEAEREFVSFSYQKIIFT